MSGDTTPSVTYADQLANPGAFGMSLIPLWHERATKDAIKLFDRARMNGFHRELYNLSRPFP
jgi:hypothetical protein